MCKKQKCNLHAFLLFVTWLLENQETDQKMNLSDEV